MSCHFGSNVRRNKGRLIELDPEEEYGIFLT
uniref:Uncharacterized protein n=1 Tax=Anguilla anguilla TaxID=7936 RepID=A0A0E9XCC9_ANGAN